MRVFFDLCACWNEWRFSTFECMCECQRERKSLCRFANERGSKINSTIIEFAQAIWQTYLKQYAHLRSGIFVAHLRCRRRCHHRFSLSFFLSLSFLFYPYLIVIIFREFRMEYACICYACATHLSLPFCAIADFARFWVRVSCMQIIDLVDSKRNNYDQRKGLSAHRNQN